MSYLKLSAFSLLLVSAALAAEPTAKPSGKIPVPVLNPPPSPTLGAAAPAGAIVLFNGSNMDAWAHHKPKQWLVPGEACHWPVADGVVTMVAGSGSVITKRDFGDFRFHAEFMTTKTPTNAGFYLMSRYELKIHETAGNPTPPSCGNFGNCNAGGAPKVNASRAKGEWQTYDVEFRAPRLAADGSIKEPARATVVLNGIKLYDNQPLTDLRLAAANLPVADHGPLQIKEHGDVVKFRNLWIVDLDPAKAAK